MEAYGRSWGPVSPLYRSCKTRHTTLPSREMELLYSNILHPKKYRKTKEIFGKINL
jgi:hypothetical protein